MGKQYKNPGQFAGSWEIQVLQPLDDRVSVQTVDDLTNIETWRGKDGVNCYHYKGMPVTIATTGDMYVYVGESGTDAVTNSANWVKVGGDSCAKGDFTTAVTVGELAKGTSVEDKTAMEILKSILYAEYAPQWNDATILLTPSGNKYVYSVGDTIPSEASFTAGGSTASAQAEGQSVAYGGAASSATNTKEISGFSTEVNASGIAEFEDTVDYSATVKVKLTRTYPAGTDLVKTSNGTTTNKTASNKTTKVSAASANSNIDSTNFTIKSITKTAEIALDFVYPVFKNNIQQTLEKNKSSYEAEQMTNAQNTLEFDIPSHYTGFRLQYWDTLLNVWTPSTGSLPVTTGSSRERTIGNDNTVKVPYTTYTYSEQNGPRKYLATFTIENRS